MSEVCVSEMLKGGLMKIMEEVKMRTVKECATKYGFNEEEAMRSLGLVVVMGVKREKKEV